MQGVGLYRSLVQVIKVHAIILLVHNGMSLGSVYIILFIEKAFLSLKGLEIKNS